MFTQTEGLTSLPQVTSKHHPWALYDIVHSTVSSALDWNSISNNNNFFTADPVRIITSVSTRLAGCTYQAAASRLTQTGQNWC